MFEWSADCNGDGIVDYGQILDGTLTDADCNGIPDECEGACCIGDGICEITIADDCDEDSSPRARRAQTSTASTSSPSIPTPTGDDPTNGIFSTIQGAIDASYDGMTISVMAGTYTGTGDSVITLPPARHHHLRHRRKRARSSTARAHVAASPATAAATPAP